VIDASAALHGALAIEPTPGLDRYELFGPPLFLSECTSSLSAAAFRGEIPEQAIQEAFERLEAMPVTVVDGGREHRLEALTLARSLGWAKTYDAEYVVLARRIGCPLLTTDERLLRGARQSVEILEPRSLENVREDPQPSNDG
jgi:predicted nucleic acid-binding protein